MGRAGVEEKVELIELGVESGVSRFGLDIDSGENRSENDSGRESVMAVAFSRAGTTI